MTTYYPFQAGPNAPYTFNPTLDGQTYIASVPWSFFGVRYYLNLAAPDGTPVLNLPLVGSPIGTAIQTISWSHGRVTVKCVAPHKYIHLATVDLTVSGCLPDAYNGIFRALVTKVDELSYPLATDPGNATMFGRVDNNVNLVAGYFQSSTLVYREPTNQFEVTP